MLFSPTIKGRADGYIHDKSFVLRGKSTVFFDYYQIFHAID